MRTWAPIFAGVLVAVCSHLRLDAADYYAAPDSKTKGDGSYAAPWRSLSEATEKLQPGDTLYLRDGTYYASDLLINLKGRADDKIRICSQPGERAKIFGGKAAAQDPLQQAWQLVDPSKRIYRRTLASDEPCAGWLATSDLLLWSYASYEDLSAPHVSGRYCGPGLFQKGKTLYLRTEPDRDGTLRAANDSPNKATEASADEATKNQTFDLAAIRLTQGERVIQLENAAHVEFVDVDFHGGTFACIDVSDKSHDISFQGCEIRFSLYGLVVREGCHDVQVSHCRINNGFPDGARWGDIKIGDPPPLEDFNSAAIVIEGAKRVTVEHSTFVRCFQALNLDGNDIRIQSNRFLLPHEACLVTPTTTAEISDNVIFHALEAFALTGGLGKKKPGRVAIHHNIVDLSAHRYVEREGNFGEFMRTRTAGWDFLGDHDCDASCERSVFLFYNNTVIGGGSSGDTGFNAEGTPLRSSYKKHIEYNNIYLSLGGNSLDRSTGSSAGNVTWRHMGENSTSEPHGLAVDPGIDLVKLRSVDPEKLDLNTLRRLYLPQNASVLTPGQPYNALDWPGTQGVTYRGAVSPFRE